MYTSEQVRNIPRNLFVLGIKPTVRAVRANLGGGALGRVGRILRETALGQPHHSIKKQISSISALEM